MTHPWGYPLRRVAGRFATRAARRVVRDPIAVLLATGLIAFWVIGGPSALPVSGTSGADTADIAAEQYMTALRDRDGALFMSTLSTEMRRMLEQRSGRAGPAAATWLFSEGERRGERIVEYRRVAHHTTVHGETFYFYVVRAERENQIRELPYTLTVSHNGKVTAVE